MYADYLQQSAGQFAKPNRTSAVLVTLGAHVALIAMLAVGLKVIVPADPFKRTEVVNVPPIKEPDAVDPLPSLPQTPVLFIPMTPPVINTAQTESTDAITITPPLLVDGTGDSGSIRPPVDESITNASIVRSFQPPYPLVSRARDEEGTVIVKIFITPFGTAGDVQVERSSGFSRLDEAAIKAVRDWKFTPAKRGSQAIAMWVSVPVKFVLNSGR